MALYLSAHPIQFEEHRGAAEKGNEVPTALLPPRRPSIRRRAEPTNPSAGGCVVSLPMSIRGYAEVNVGANGNLHKIVKTSDGQGTERGGRREVRPGTEGLPKLNEDLRATKPESRRTSPLSG